MNYTEYKENKQSEYNALPIFYAFSDKQFEDAMKKRGLTVDDTDKIYRLGSTGGFYLKKDAELIRAYFSKKDDLHDMMQDYDFALSAFNYEMDNHEYQINWQGDYDVCSCFGHCEYAENKGGADYLREMGFDDSVISAYKQAKKEHYKRAENWF